MVPSANRGAVWLDSERLPSSSSRRAKGSRRKTTKKAPHADVVKTGQSHEPDPSSDELDNWRRAWRELWDAERNAERDALEERLRASEDAIRELRATLAREKSLHGLSVEQGQSWVDEAVEATRTVAQRESEARAALQVCRQQLEATKLRAAKAEARAAELAARAAAAEDARRLSERTSASQLAASREEVGDLRQQLAKRAAGIDEVEAARDDAEGRATSAESDARQLQIALATSEETARVRELDASRAEAQAAMLAAELGARETELAWLAHETGAMCAPATGEAESLLPPDGMTRPVVSPDGEAALRNARAACAASVELSVGAATLADELRHLDGLDASVLEVRRALAQSAASCDALRTRAEAAEAGRDAFGRRAEALEGELISTHDAMCDAEARFGTAVAQIRESVDAQLAVQSQRLRVWEELVSTGRPEGVSMMNAHAGIALIRGRRHLGDLGDLLREERALIAEQGRVFAAARPRAVPAQQLS